MRVAWSRSRITAVSRSRSRNPTTGFSASATRSRAVSTDTTSTSSTAPSVELVAEGRGGPGQPDHLPRPQRLHDHRATVGHVDLDGDTALGDEVRDVSRAPFTEEQHAGAESGGICVLGHQRDGRGGKAGQERWLEEGYAPPRSLDVQRTVSGTDGGRLLGDVDADRSTQAMQRPQPTQPDVSNWSHQVDSLWVSHCRYRDEVVGRMGPPCR